MFFDGEIMEREGVLGTARRMCTAARTAPKARGTDAIVTAVLTGEDRMALAGAMERHGQEQQLGFFHRDAENLLLAEAVVLIGVKNIPRNLSFCGYCGFPDCSACLEAGGICAHSMADLGIAVGSAVSVASSDRVDNRVFFSAGKTALADKVLGDGVVAVYAIPLSATSKNIFFDR